MLIISTAKFFSKEQHNEQLTGFAKFPTSEVQPTARLSWISDMLIQYPLPSDI